MRRASVDVQGKRADGRVGGVRVDLEQPTITPDDVAKLREAAIRVAGRFYVEVLHVRTLEEREGGQ